MILKEIESIISKIKMYSYQILNKVRISNNSCLRNMGWKRSHIKRLQWVSDKHIYINRPITTSYIWQIKTRQKNIKIENNKIYLYGHISNTSMFMKWLKVTFQKSINSFIRLFPLVFLFSAETRTFKRKLSNIFIMLMRYRKTKKYINYLIFLEYG